MHPSRKSSRRVGTVTTEPRLPCVLRGKTRKPRKSAEQLSTSNVQLRTFSADVWASSVRRWTLSVSVQRWTLSVEHCSGCSAKPAGINRVPRWKPTRLYAIIRSLGEGCRREFRRVCSQARSSFSFPFAVRVHSGSGRQTEGRSGRLASGPDQTQSPWTDPDKRYKLPFVLPQGPRRKTRSDGTGQDQGRARNLSVREKSARKQGRKGEEK